MTGLKAFLRTHATGSTIVLIVATAVVLSLLPVPDWARPLDVFREPEPLRALAAIALKGSAPAPEGAGGGADLPPPSDEDEPMKEEVVPAVAKAREPWVEPNREKYHRVRAEVGAEPQPLVIPCADGTETRCTRRALDRFFSALAEIEDGAEDTVVRVVHYGDSLIASDHITDMVRLRLHERFGSAGRGTLLVDRLSRFAGRRVRTGLASKNWKLDVITMGKPPDRFFGYTGASFTAEKAGERSVFDLGQNRSVEVFYLRHPAGGVLELYADKELIKTVDTKGEPESSVIGLQLPETAKQLVVRAKTKGVRIFGVSLEAGVSGVIYESLGMPGATAKVWLVPDETDFKQHLIHRDPRLVVTMLGGNDALALSKSRTTEEDITRYTTDFIRRIRAAAPDTDCLVVSAMDSGKSSVGGGTVSKPQVPIVVELQRKVALAEGCAFWDMFASMGGTGSIGRWFKARLINPDMIHPKGYGGDLLGEMMVTAMMNAYDAFVAAAHPPVAGGEPVPPGAVEGSRAIPPPEPPEQAEDEPRTPEPGAARDDDEAPLGPFFSRLAELERDKSGRVAIALLGSSHLARHFMTDELRDRLGARFGHRGRGYSSCGRGARVLEDAGVKRAITGRAEIHDGRELDREQRALVGMSGVRTELKKNARFTYAPCARCDSRVPSIFELYYLSRPGMGAGRIDVTGSGQIRTNRSSSNDTGLVFKRITTTAARPKLTVENRGPGSLELLGVSHELDRAGVVVDPIAYPGVTPEMVLRWNQDLVLGMLSRRRPDLLVLFYGETEAQDAPLDERAYRRDYARLLRSLREGAGDVPCLVLGALVSLESSGGKWVEPPSAALLRRAQEEVASAEGCVYWSPRGLLEDGGTIDQLYLPEKKGARGLSERALRHLGQRFAGAVIEDYERWLREQERANPPKAAVRTGP